MDFLEFCSDGLDHWRHFLLNFRKKILSDLFWRRWVNRIIVRARPISLSSQCHVTVKSCMVWSMVEKQWLLQEIYIYTFYLLKVCRLILSCLFTLYWLSNPIDTIISTMTQKLTLRECCISLFASEASIKAICMSSKAFLFWNISNIMNKYRWKVTMYVM